jgi:hypothetical protein
MVVELDEEENAPWELLFAREHSHCNARDSERASEQAPSPMIKTCNESDKSYVVVVIVVHENHGSTYNSWGPSIGNIQTCTRTSRESGIMKGDHPRVYYMSSKFSFVSPYVFAEQAQPSANIFRCPLVSWSQPKPPITILVFCVMRSWTAWQIIAYQMERLGAMSCIRCSLNRHVRR